MVLCDSLRPDLRQSFPPCPINGLELSRRVLERRFARCASAKVSSPQQTARSARSRSGRPRRRADRAPARGCADRSVAAELEADQMILLVGGRRPAQPVLRAGLALQVVGVARRAGERSRPPVLQIVAAIVACVTAGLSDARCQRPARADDGRARAAPQRGKRDDDERGGDREQASSTTEMCMPSNATKAAGSASVRSQTTAVVTLRASRQGRATDVVAGERPDDDGDPRDADHVRLQAEEEHGGKRRARATACGSAAGRAPATTR